MTEKFSVMHALEDDPAFRGVRFGDHSGEVDWADAVKFAAESGGVLQSAREAAAFYFYAKGEHNTGEEQATRTVSIGFKAGNKFYHAVDDSANPEQNILLARIGKKYSEYDSMSSGSWLLPIADPLVKAALSRAEKTGRIVEASSAGSVDLDTITAHGRCEFARHGLVRAILLDFAGKYAKTTLETHNSDVCQICSLTPDKLKEHGVNSKYVDVQPVSIDWISVFAIGFAGLYDILDRVGRACAVHGARDFSAQHKVVRLPGKGLYERIRKITEEKK